MPVGFMNVSQPWDVQGENASAALQRQQVAVGRQQEQAQAIQNQNAGYAQQMDRAANDAFAESLDERGRPNADKYIAGLKKRGAFDPAHAAGAYQYLAANMDTLAKAGQSMATMEALGITPPEFTKAPRAIEGSNVHGDLAAATPDVAPGRVPDPDFGGTMAAPKGGTEVPQPGAKHWSEEAFPVVRIGATPEAAPPVPTTQYEAPQQDWVNEALASRKPVTGGGMAPLNAEDDFQRSRISYDAMKGAWKGTDAAPIDATLRALGEAQPGQEALMRQIDRVVSAVPQARPHFKDGKFDLDATIEDKNTYPARVQEARNKAIEYIKSGQADAIEKMLSIEGNQRAETAQNMAVDQQTHALVKGYVAPGDKDKIGQMSAAVTDLAHLVQAPPDPNGPKWIPYKMIVTKNVMKAFDLPVTEGVMDDLSQSIASGQMSKAEIGSALQKHGVTGAAANAASQYLGVMAGTMGPEGMQLLGQQAAEFSKNFVKSKYAGRINKGVMDQLFPTPKILGAKAAQGSHPQQMGSVSNPYPAGQEPPIGAHYIHPRTGAVMLRTK